MYLIGFLTLILFSCNGKEEKPFNYPVQEENSTIYERTLILKESEQIVFPINETTTFRNFSIQFTSVGDTEYFSFVNVNDNSLVYYDLSKKEEVKIPLALEGGQGIGKLRAAQSPHIFVSPDSIFIYNARKGQMFLINQKGQVKSKFSLFDWKTEKVPVTPFTTNLSSALKINQVVYLPCLPSRFIENYETGAVLKYDLKSGEREFIFPFSNMYQQAFWGGSIKYSPSLAYNTSDNYLAIRFPIDPYIYQAKSNGEMLNKYYLGSEEFGAIKPMSHRADLLFEKKRDWEEENLYTFSNPSFNGILYDPYRNLYYSITKIPPSIEEVKKGKSLAAYTIIICDKDFNKLGEQTFDIDKYDAVMIAVSKQGLAIGRRDLYDQDDNYLTFSIFTPQKIENL